MNILAIECSTSPVSAAIVSGSKIIGFSYSDVKITHSQTLFPVIRNALTAGRLDFSDIEAIAVAIGPGSFTGLRIGIASAKGLAEPRKLKCVGVSTLLAAAYMFLGENAVICPVIDARCSQVYNALFEVNGNTVTRICDDRAILIDDLLSELKTIHDKRIILCCDAAQSVFKVCKQDNVSLAPPLLQLQNAVGAALYAEEAIKENGFCDPKELAPLYIKLPQAERELRAKQRKEVEK
ncbi:MAG: tRNA (adenosine(37)-N6)-threonylcarbamoyltransferase complex dimerization subunit type 1 TsaB [Clostridia bacterium]|nr:tRNA (adenosine(37)-N6)-threonylcarbamoyltransferase complex dimerization subunit type 1 TsaB [Clostridia bacterium]